jgi:hypothetical protein
LKEQSESKGISPTFSKSMAKRIWVLQKFVKMKQNKVKHFKILHVQDRSKTNIFVSNCVEEEKRKNEASFFLGKKRRKTNIIVAQLSKICHCYQREQDCRDRVILRMHTWKCVRQNNSLIGPNMVRAL